MHCAKRDMLICVLDSTYGAKKEKFARCLTNFYESNADRLDRELSDTELPRELHFTAFAGAQTRIGTTTQAIQYAGYLADCGKRVCYVEETGDFFPQKLFEIISVCGRERRLHYLCRDSDVHRENDARNAEDEL